MSEPQRRDALGPEPMRIERGMPLWVRSIEGLAWLLDRAVIAHEARILGDLVVQSASCGVVLLRERVAAPGAACSCLGSDCLDARTTNSLASG